jgi:hypothetical protein
MSWQTGRFEVDRDKLHGRISIASRGSCLARWFELVFVVRNGCVRHVSDEPKQVRRKVVNHGPAVPILP